ncbi:MAG: hypothetical protein WDA24_06460 [Tissierellales bacterium]
MYYYYENKSLDKLPIVLLPGLFGSLGDDILPGTGKFSFGMAEHVYRPLIDILKELGYKEGEDLFIAYYDWRKGCEYNTEKYLIPKIEEAKRVTRMDKVDVIGHSLGGLVARTYIQGALYNGDIRNLIMIGTPNSGAVNAYYFWSGGQMPYDKLEKNIIFQLLKIGFLWIYRFLYGEIGDVTMLRELFPVAEELLPSYEYGNYLFYDDKGGIKKPVAITQMESVNKHLNQINRTKHLVFSRGVLPYHIIGTGLETTDIICVDRNGDGLNKWFDGKPIYSISMPYGDGTITMSSAESVYSKNYYLNSNHGDILKKTKDILASILMRPDVPKKDSKGVTGSDYMYSIIVKDGSISKIHFADKEKDLKISGSLNAKNLISKKIGENLNWVMLSSKGKEKLELEIKAENDKNYEVLVFFAEKNGKVEMVRKSFSSKNTSITLLGASYL